MGRLFGTDGIRGLATAELTPVVALGVAVSAAHVLAERSVHDAYRAAVAASLRRMEGAA